MSQQDSKKYVHVVFSCDENWLKAMMVTINSILINCKDCRRLFFHFLVDQESSMNELNTLLHEKFLSRQFIFEYEIKLPESKALKFLSDNIRVSFDRIGNIMNFARFLFPDTFPDLNKIIYVDIDMVFQEDIIRLYKTEFKKGKYLLALADKKFGQTMDHQFLKKYHLDKNYQGFNAGLFVTKLRYWRDKNVLQQIQKIMIANKKSKTPFFQFGTQPLMNVVFYEKYQHLHKLWQIKDLGWKLDISEKKIKEGRVLHWNGPAKGWYSNGLYQKYWDKYQIKEWKDLKKPKTSDFDEDGGKLRLQKLNQEKSKLRKLKSKNTFSRKRTQKG